MGPGMAWVCPKQLIASAGLHDVRSERLVAPAGYKYSRSRCLKGYAEAKRVLAGLIYY